MTFKLLNYAGRRSEARAAILVDDDAIIDLQDAVPGKAWAASTLAVLSAWDEALPALRKLAGTKAKSRRRLADVRLLAPLLYPPAIYCAGANYADHAAEMSAEGKGVDKATTQPYFFL